MACHYVSESLLFAISFTVSELLGIGVHDSSAFAVPVSFASIDHTDQVVCLGQLLEQSQPLKA